MMSVTRNAAFELRGSREPDKVAIVMARSGQSLTYGDLEARVNRSAHTFRQYDMKAGDTVAICIENSLQFFEIVIAALRCGLVVVPVSITLTAGEIAFVVGDSSAKMLVASPGLGDAFLDLPGVVVVDKLVTTGESCPGFLPWSEVAAAHPATPIDDEAPGTEMLYSSGTTGRPKGIVYHGTSEGAPSGMVQTVFVMERMGFTEDTVYLCPAPLYHSAPFMFSLNVLRLGGTVVVMEKFDPELALQLIERHRIDIAQFVPTHFVRILKLPQHVRTGYDISSLRLVLHAAAPCPAEIKHEMIRWVGPILLEYFGSTEQAALTIIDSTEWLSHPGSVGRCALGRLHICDADGEPVPTGQIGTIYSEGGMDFSYLGDPEKTRAARNRHGWTTVGDMGYLDDEGYLYLTDRGTFMIITGGVNVYPQEIENLLITHPRILDVAVVGVPDIEMGEIVTAVIHPRDMADARPEFAEELAAWVRQRLSGVKTPKRYEFWQDLPRLPTGKMKKDLVLKKLAAQSASA